MEQHKESMGSIVKRAPKGATHYTYPDIYENEVFWNIEENVIKSVWIPLSCFSDPASCWYEDSGYWRTDYSDNEDQPYVEWDNLVELPKHIGKWEPELGDVVLFKRNDSIDYAYDSPERMEVVAIVGDKVWLKNALRDLVTNLDNISPLEKEKSLREELVEIMSLGGQQNYVDVYRAADRLIRAGVELEGR